MSKNKPNGVAPVPATPNPIMVVSDVAAPVAKPNGVLRSTWKGTLGIGLLSFPVKLYKARTEKNGTGLKLICSCGAAVEQKYRCVTDGKLSTRSECQHGYEMPDGTMMPVPESAFGQLPLNSTRAMDILGFMPVKTDLLGVKDIYYIMPDKGGEKAYSLFLYALTAKDVMAYTKVSFRDKEQPAVVMPGSGILTLITMAYPDEVKAPPAFVPANLADKEREAGLMLVDKFMLDTPPTFTDEYRGALENLIVALASGKEVPQIEAPKQAEPDLLSGLMAMVE